MARSLFRKGRLCLDSLGKFRPTANDHQMLPRIVMNRRPAWRTEITAALACLALSAVPQISGDPGTAVASSQSLTATVLLADREFPCLPCRRWVICAAIGPAQDPMGQK